MGVQSLELRFGVELVVVNVSIGSVVAAAAVVVDVVRRVSVKLDARFGISARNGNRSGVARNTFEMEPNCMD